LSSRIYRITAPGERRFQELLREQFEAGGSAAQTLYGAMLFLHLADLPTTADLLLLEHVKNAGRKSRNACQTHQTTGGSQALRCYRTWRFEAYAAALPLWGRGPETLRLVGVSSSS
jgi:hypothetical protein